MRRILLALLAAMIIPSSANATCEVGKLLEFKVTMHGVRPLADIEAEVIRFAIAHYRGQMSEVARKLQIGRSTLYRKLDDLGVEDTGAAAPSADSVAAG